MTEIKLKKNVAKIIRFLWGNDVDINLSLSKNIKIILFLKISNI